MRLYTNLSASHLKEGYHGPLGNVEMSYFQDGELNVVVDDELSDKDVLVLINTNPPVMNLFESIFLLEELFKKNARIHLIVTYLGYARKEPTKMVGNLVLELLQRVPLESFRIVHPHSKEFISEDCMKIVLFKSLFENEILNSDILVAPDEGALTYIEKVSQFYKKPTLLMEKKRLPNSNLRFSFASELDIKNQRLLIIDDIVSSGKTLFDLAEILNKKGPKKISAAVVHALFNQEFLSLLEKSSIEQIAISNTIKQDFTSDRIKVRDVQTHIWDLLDL